MHPARRRVRRSVRPGKDRERAFFFHGRNRRQIHSAPACPEKSERFCRGKSRRSVRYLAKNVQPQEERAV